MGRALHLQALEKTTAKIAELTRGRDDLMRAAIEAGFSSAQVAEATGLTRQRVWQITKTKA